MIISNSLHTRENMFIATKVLEIFQLYSDKTAREGEIKKLKSLFENSFFQPVKMDLPLTLSENISRETFLVKNAPQNNDLDLWDINMKILEIKQARTASGLKELAESE